MHTCAQLFTCTKQSRRHACMRVATHSVLLCCQGCSLHSWGPRIRGGLFGGLAAGSPERACCFSSRNSRPSSSSCCCICCSGSSGSWRSRECLFTGVEIDRQTNNNWSFVCPFLCRLRTGETEVCRSRSGEVSHICFIASYYCCCSCASPLLLLPFVFHCSIFLILSRSLGATTCKDRH